MNICIHTQINFTKKKDFGVIMRVCTTIYGHTTKKLK